MSDDGLTNTPCRAVVHHVDPVKVMTSYVDFYKELYGDSAGGAFGMSADFSERGDTYTSDYWSAKANDTLNQYPGLRRQDYGDSAL